MQENDEIKQAIADLKKQGMEVDEQELVKSLNREVDLGKDLSVELAFRYGQLMGTNVTREQLTENYEAPAE